MAIRKRPNPAVAASERAAKASESMYKMATMDLSERMSSLPLRIANRKRATANKIKKNSPFLIERDRAQ